jgi:D-alanine-D-alanine ligase
MVIPGPTRTRLVLLYGGQSAEHEISCISALHVLRAVDPSRYDVQLIGVTTSGEWIDATAVGAQLDGSATALPQPDELVAAGALMAGEPPTDGEPIGSEPTPTVGGVLAEAADGRGVADGDPAPPTTTPPTTTPPTTTPPAAAPPTTTPPAAAPPTTTPPAAAPPTTAQPAAATSSSLVPVIGAADLAPGQRSGDSGPLVVFPVLHGPKGEDGTVQGLLEMAGVAYVGAGVAGSAAAMDKGMAKALFAAAGIPQARYLDIRAHESDHLLAKTSEAELGWPVFVKPANLGSTIGISRANGPAELAAAVDLALRYDEYLVIEEAIRAREIEVGVLGDRDLRVSVPGEILPSRDFYDFEDKYLAGTAQWQIPAQLPAEVAAQIPELARAACRALRVEGMARVDFFYEEATGRLLVNEINTIPGFTPISMYPQMWAASGVGYRELIDELVANAVARHDRRSRFLTSRPGA